MAAAPQLPDDPLVYLHGHAVYMNSMVQIILATLAASKVAPPDLVEEAMDSISMAYQVVLSTPGTEGREVLEMADVLMQQALDRFRARLVGRHRG